MLMESVQGLSFFNVGTRRLEKVVEVLDKHMKESLIHRSQFLVIIFRCRPLLSDKGSS